jgi:hypothetical protein
MATEGFREIKVVHRSREGDRAWMVEVDPAVPLMRLAPELIDTLPIEGTPEDFDLRNEGSLDQPVLVLEAKSRRNVGRYREAP